MTESNRPLALLGLLEPIFAHCSAQFPRTCPSCGREYADFAAYLEGTRPRMIVDLDLDDEPDPIGALSLADCACESTLALDCAGRDPDEMREFHRRLAVDVADRSPETVLRELRAALRARATS